MATTTPPPTPTRLVATIRTHLKRNGSVEHALGVQWFFKDEIRSYGWYTAALRKYARTVHQTLAGDRASLLAVAEPLFKGAVLEEKVLAVLVVQRAIRRLGVADLSRFDRWLDDVCSWADHDALAMCLIGPLFVAHPTRVRRVFTWARSRNRWRRRAAAVSLIHGVRTGRFEPEAAAITERLLRDEDDMVQKGLGWLLREWCKACPERAVPVVWKIRTDAPRLVLRTACETLPAAERKRILAR